MNKNNNPNQPSPAVLIRIMLGACLGFIIFLMGVFILNGDISVSPADFASQIKIKEYGFWLAIVLALVAIVWIAIALTPTPPKQDRDGLAVKKMLDDPFVRRTILRFEIGGIFAGVFALVFAIWSLQQTNYQTKLAQEALKDQRISSAWQILAQPGRGATGKSYALEILANETDEVLSGLQLGCTVDVEHKVLFEREHSFCRYPVPIQNVELGSNEQSELYIKNSEFSYADFGDVAIQNAFLSDVKFEGSKLDLFVRDADLLNVNFSDSGGKIQFDHVSLNKVDFSKSNATVEISKSELEYVSFSGMTGQQYSFKVGGFIPKITISDSILHQVDFTNYNFVSSGLKLSGKSNLSGNPNDYPETHVMDGVSASSVRLNISGAIFCELKNNGELACWEQADQQFFNNAWFFEDNPPVGIELLPFKVNLNFACLHTAIQSDYYLDTLGNSDAFRADCHPDWLGTAY